MTEVAAILVKANVRTALLVDDAYDQVPLASDLALDGDEWTHFFEDLSEDDRTQLREAFGGFDTARGDALSTSDAFVAALWSSRAVLRPVLIDPLFSRYRLDTAADQAYLANLQERLQACGLDCDTAGRQFHAKGAVADLIVIDLYLGSAQTDGDIKTSINGLIEVIRERRSNPPLVVLMSRSTRLEEKRSEFRDKAGLFESAFRIIRKVELGEAGRLERLLMRLASHYEDSRKLAAFLSAWDKGIDAAKTRTSILIRTLDLPDYAQIRELLLNAEGEPTGSYLVDVFDRVLQHETEREAAVIEAAMALNALTSSAYPPPYVAGSRDLQNLVYRSLFQNRERLRLPASEGGRVAFGDLLRRKTQTVPAAQAVTEGATRPLDDIDPDEVLAVLTPACDLMRTAAKRILFLVGSLRPLAPSDWSYKDDPIRTPVIELADGHRFWIKWNLRHIETLSHAEVDQVLGDPSGFEIVARMRESHSLELQQKLLSSLGRVGLTAPMPATFPMRVEAYLPDVDRRPRRLDVEALHQLGGVCYVGREGEKEMRLVLCEDACEAICSAIDAVDLGMVHPSAHEAVSYLRATGELLQALEKGIALPSPKAQGFKEIGSATGALTEGANPKTKGIGLISRNTDPNGLTMATGDVRKSGVVIMTWDTEPDAG